jgi:hypothetical protein
MELIEEGAVLYTEESLLDSVGRQDSLYEDVLPGRRRRSNSMSDMRRFEDR